MKDPGTRRRSLAKALSWRAVSLVMTSGLVWAITGSLQTGMAVGGIDFAAKFSVFYYHERLWHQIKWGKHNGVKDLS